MDFESQYPNAPADLNEASLHNILAASIRYRIAFGPRAGKMILKIRTTEPSWEPANGESFYKNKCSFIDGFSLHANVEVSSKRRDRLELLLRYINRPAIPQERISQDKNGKIILELKKIYRDGTTHFQFSQEEFIEKLIALVPPPRGNLIRFCGVLAPNSHNMKKIIPKNSESSVNDAQKKKTCYWIPWAELLKRVYVFDALRCEFCIGSMKIIAFIHDTSVAKRILIHLNLPSEPPKLMPARDPPEKYFSFYE